jgi:hypothetical protein
MTRMFQFLSRLTVCERILVFLFVATLPLVNPWVRGDGVGYYAFARAIVVQHNLDFSKDWMDANSSFRMGRVDEDNRIFEEQYTRTHHLDNHFAIGPAILWSPFLLATHAVVLLADRAGARIPADGFSRPYTMTMALSTALYGFLALWISFRMARRYVPERTALLGTLGVWFASSLPVYMYFNPSWSHAHSAFVDTLFIWYWHRTCESRTWGQWILLGLISGLIVDVYFLNGVLLIIPLAEAVVRYARTFQESSQRLREALRLFGQHVTYVLFFAVAMLPTFISRLIIYGSPFKTGYPTVGKWAWSSPAFFSVLFSADHGLFSWTPIVLLAVIGLFLFIKADRSFALYLLLAVVAFYVVVAAYPFWDGLSSFGNRFFISLTPAFILGLAALFNWLSKAWNEAAAFRAAATTVVLLIIWNLGLVFQWGTHLIPPRGPISFREAAYNQVAVVPEVAFQQLKSYFTRRHEMMNQIEQQDVRQLKSAPAEGSE